jgi:hypothetical protein
LLPSYDPVLTSPIATASANGASQSEILYKTIFGVPDAAISSILNQDINGFARASGTLAGAAGLGVAGTRFGNTPVLRLAGDALDFSRVTLGEILSPNGNRFTAQRGSVDLKLLVGTDLVDFLGTKNNGASSAGKTVTLYRVDDAGFAPRITADGSIPIVRTSTGGERALFVNIDQPLRAKEFNDVNRNKNAIITAVEVDASFLEKLRTTAIYDKGTAVRSNSMAPLRVDINKAPDQFGLRTPEQIQWLRDAIKPNTVRIIDPKDIR